MVPFPIKEAGILAIATGLRRKSKVNLNKPVQVFIATLVVLAFLAVSQQPAFAQESASGFIQVKCDPGVQIFLGGNLKGVTNADTGGLILQDVPAGNHEIKAIKPGYQPQIDTTRYKVSNSR